MQEVVKQETNEFASTAAKQGRITSLMMQDYLKKLSATGNQYEIDILHDKIAYDPEYRFRTAQEIIEEQNNSYGGLNQYTYREVISERPAVDDPEPEHLTMNSETNESVMAGAHNSGPAAGHIHNQNCYDGHVHTGEPFFSLKHTHGPDCDKYLKYTYAHYYCPHCQKHYVDLMSFMYLTSSGSRVYNNWSGNYYPESSITCIHCMNKVYGLSYNDWEAIWDYECGFGLQEYYGYTNDWINTYGNQPTNSMKANPQQRLYENAINDGQEHEYKFHDNVPDWRFYQHKNVNGCHYFHRRTVPYGMEYYDGLYYVLDRDEWAVPSYTYWKALQDMKSGGVDAFCAVPESYYLHGGYSSSDSYSCGVGYKIEVTPEREFLFRLEFANVYYDYEIQRDREYFKYIPQTLTIDGMIDAFRDPIAFLKTYVNDWYVASKIYNPNPNRSLYSESGTYLICKDEHGWILDDNRWYTSCGQKSEGVCKCSSVITGITATHPTQAIYAGDSMITTIRVSYLDGSQKTVIGSCDFNTRNLGINQTAVIYLDGQDTPTTSKRFEVPITIAVLAKTRTCSHGHTYHLSNDGHDPGCPYCKSWLQSLTLAEPSSGYLEIYQGTTLESNGVKLKATYYDGHTEYVTSGYVDNLDPIFIGVENVTIGYKGLYVGLRVKVNRRVKQCTICGRHYELYPDGSDPGCPYCIALTPVFTGNIMTYYTQCNLEDITEKISHMGTYLLSEGDEIKIEVTQKNKTMADRLLAFLGMEDAAKIHLWTSKRVREQR